LDKVPSAGLPEMKNPHQRVAGYTPSKISTIFITCL
jgi:hypothetical protein